VVRNTRDAAEKAPDHQYTRKRVRGHPKPANPPTGSGAKPANVTTGPRSAAEPYRSEIETALNKGLTAQRIWQDLREDYGFSHSYSCIRRFVRGLKRSHPEVAGVMEHPPGKEAQVDFFQGPPTLCPKTGRWRRPWIFRMTLSCSRHGYEEAMWEQDHRHFLAAHEHAFANFGGVPEVVRHDNLKAAVVRACLYDPDASAQGTAQGQSGKPCLDPADRVRCSTGPLPTARF